ncbi:cyclic nucleotide-binding domain protein (macronuclear) [Tetrahymena thermophila SB210]|uniref:Cyclic nucleotide-binding domain protein n=1 Tax=Tetrahymena thermophila (strain SB210) TaxID=312017 RepID=Q22MW8_TETTS|nr:cyclic nucleotide-binding domain protein [Tetrahymena thermophila SB210]EAR86575.2 cyclic nucleotide-binding domain protein [Tetrahymena thermophila SB210]|eukprot:XP_976902.2 cyclic nucleotide-binding domain protein [Tetrahymena thermophila SB210]
MFNSILVNKMLPIIEAGQCLDSEENKEQMVEALLQIKHFYTLIRYESQKEYLFQFMQKMKLIKSKRGQIIYEKGAQNEGLYLLIKGNLSIWEPKTQGEINDEIGLITKLEKFAKIGNQSDDIKKKVHQTQFLLDFIRKKQDDELFKNQKEQYFLTENICSLKRVRYIYPGDSLNEDCVVSGAKTQYTVMSQEDSCILYISQHDYLKIFDLEISKLNFILDVLKKNFPNSKIDSLRRLSYKFKEEIFPYGSIIFHQDDPANLFMIIKSGCVEISKILYPDDDKSDEKIAQKKHKEKKARQKTEESKEEDNQQKSTNKKKKTQQYTQEEEDAYLEYQRYYGSSNDNPNQEKEEEELEQEIMQKHQDEENLQQKKKKKKSMKIKQQSVLSPVKYLRNVSYMKLGIIGAGEILGLEDYIKHKTRSFQAQSIAADTAIYYVSKKKIDDVIDLNEDLNLKKAMKQNGNVKIEWYSGLQSKISNINSIQELKSEEIITAEQVKKRFTGEEEINFKSVVSKLFNERRQKIVEDMIRKEINNCPIKIQNFPTLNSPQKEQNNQEISKQQQVNDHKFKSITQSNTPKEGKSGESTKQNKLSFFQELQDSLYKQQDVNQNALDIHQLNPNQNIKQQQPKYTLQVNSEKKIPSEALNSINEESKQDKQNLQKLLTSNNNFQDNYEKRFRTILDQSCSPPKQQNKKINSESQRKSMNDLHSKKNNTSILLDDHNQQSSQKEIQLVRSYQLETASLSLQQKIQYKIKSNSIISSKYKKYDPQNSKSFLEARKIVKILRQSQQSKSIQQGNILKQMREERQSSLSQIVQNIVNDSQNTSNLNSNLITDKDQAVSCKRINLLGSLCQINDISQSIIRIPPNDSHSIIQEEEAKEKNQKSITLPPIIHSISPDHRELQHLQKKSRKGDKNNIFYSQQQLSNIEERIGSLYHFQSPKNQNSRQVNPSSSAVTNVPQNDDSNSCITSNPLKTETVTQSEKKTKQYSKFLDGLNDEHEQSHLQNSSLSNIQENNQNLRKSLQLPQINHNNNQSFIQSMKLNISPQISFSVKMSRKNINRKYNDIYQSNQNIPKSKTERQITISDSQSQQSLITVNKLDIAEEVKEKVQNRLKRQSDVLQVKSNNKKNSILSQRFPSLGKLSNNSYQLNIQNQIIPQTTKTNKIKYQFSQEKQIAF